MSLTDTTVMVTLKIHIFKKTSLKKQKKNLLEELQHSTPCLIPRKSEKHSSEEITVPGRLWQKLGFDTMNTMNTWTFYTGLELCQVL